MNCQEALSLLYDIIDKEASEVDTQKVQEHLSKCRDCFEVYRLEKSIHGFIEAKLGKANSDVELTRLKSKVVTKLDEIDRESVRRSPFRLVAMSLAAAAVIVLLIGAVSLVTDFIGHDRNYIPLERAHFAAIENFEDYSAGNPASFDLSRICNDLHYNLKQEVNGFSLVSSSTVEVLGVEMGHFVYSNDNRIISVFVAPSDKFSIPDELHNTMVVKNDVEFFDHFCRGCHLVFHKCSSAVIITATKDPDTELLDFIPGHMVI